MRHKKFISLLLLFALVFSIGIPVSARTPYANYYIQENERTAMPIPAAYEDVYKRQAQGCGYLCGGELVFSSSLNSYSVNRRLLRVPGLFNAENLLTAIAACAGIVTQEDIESVASEFSGVEHRLEFVRELRGVKYYNLSLIHI